jgi:hypothetical protein
MKSLRVGVLLAEIQYLRNKLGVDVNIIARVYHLRNSIVAALLSMNQPCIAVALKIVHDSDSVVR